MRGSLIVTSVALALALASPVGCAPQAREQEPGTVVSTRTPPPSEPSSPTTAPPSGTTEATRAPKPKPKVDAAVPSAGSLYRRTIAKRRYRSWSKAPGFSRRQPGTGPHGPRVIVYVNDVVDRTLDRSSARRWAVGSKIAKDGFDDSGRLIKVAYMHKTRRGWYFAEWDGEGNVIAAGLRDPLCADCHARGDDSVRSFGLP
ncbi:MAG: hypothetical protein HY876_04560 [Coriobacteriales bacterium]|nr:hypothetical protein [Coriobacteriales bacterium]